jgi:hypothetical protein
VRTGTWNMQGRWTPEHESFMRNAECDVWLLTEVNDRVRVSGYTRHVSTDMMLPWKRWSGIYSHLPMTALPDPCIGSTAAVIAGTTFCCSTLPWRGCGPLWPGARHVDQTQGVVAELLNSLPTDGLVWGGDWNHALSGDEWAGSKGGRGHVLAAVEQLGLQVPTAALPHRIDGLLSIDHIAVSAGMTVVSADCLAANGLSDHDSYIIEAAMPPGPA